MWIYVMLEEKCVSECKFLGGFTSSAQRNEPAKFKYSWACFGVWGSAQFSLSQATCPHCWAKSQLTHIHTRAYMISDAQKHSQRHVHAHTHSPSCNKWGPDCVWWWWWCKRPGMLVSMVDELCWVNVGCVCACWCVCVSRGVKPWSTCHELLSSPCFSSL